jgi:hypothetical protein
MALIIDEVEDSVLDDLPELVDTVSVSAPRHRHCNHLHRDMLNVVTNGVLSSDVQLDMREVCVEIAYMFLRRERQYRGSNNSTVWARWNRMFSLCSSRHTQYEDDEYLALSAIWECHKTLGEYQADDRANSSSPQGVGGI